MLVAGLVRTADPRGEYCLWIAFIAAVGLGVGGYMKNQESEDAITGPSAPPPTAV
jgi:hypothetical protein